MSWELLAIVPMLSLLMFVHELGHFVVARRARIVVQEFGFGLPPRIIGVKKGDVIYSLNLIPFGAFVRMLGEEDPNEPGSFASKGRITRSGVLVAGPGMNFVLAVVAFTLAYMVGWPSPNQEIVQIARVVPGSPAEAAGLQEGDIVLEMKGERVRRLEDFQARTKESLGGALPIKVRRGNEVIEVSVVPRENPPEGQGAVGVLIQHPIEPIQRPLPQSLWLGFREAVYIVAVTLTIPVKILEGAISPEMARIIGLPGMAQLASGAVDHAVETGWWFPMLLLTGTFSAGLAVANLLPLPGLDGGRLLFVIIEAIRGRRVDPEMEGRVHFVGLLVLLTVMFLVSYNDLVNPIPSVDWSFR